MSGRTPTGTSAGRTPAVAQSIGAAVLAYMAAGVAEIGLIRTVRPSEVELAWVSDVVLASAFGVAVYLWRHLEATRQALLERERAEIVLNTQLSIAADLQRRLLPALPGAGGALEWAAALRSAGQIGGDFYDLVPLDQERTMLLVADVSGKGIPAAMALSTLRAAFRAFARRSSEPASVLTQLSAALYEQWGGTPYFTGIVALVDESRGRLVYANAAHPAAIVLGPSGLRALESLGPPAALLPGCVYYERSLDIGRGDSCVFVSDGVTEALGEGVNERLEGLMRSGAAVPGFASALCESVMAVALTGRGPEGVADWDDDRTVVVLTLLDDIREPKRTTTAIPAVTS